MSRFASLRAVLLAITLISLVLPASAQVLSDTFSDGSPGNFWNVESGNPSLRVIEQNGRLEFFADTNQFMPDLAFAGYVAKGWHLAPTTEILARIIFRSNPSGTLANPDSEAGIAIIMGNADASPLPSGLRPGVAFHVGEGRFSDLTHHRSFGVSPITPLGPGDDLVGGYAYLAAPTVFYDWNTNLPSYEIPLQSTVYLKYSPSLDRLALSLVGYSDPEALVLFGVRGGATGPVQFSIGGYATYPGGLTGTNAWWDNFIIDSGALETAVQNLSASDGTFSDKVRLTWTPAIGAAGYQIYRNDEPDPIAILGPTANSFDDLTASAGVLNTYEVGTVTAAGYWQSTFDNGWRNLPAPTGLVATDGTLTSSVDLAWNGVSDSMGYRVFRAVGASAPVSIATPDTTSFSDTTAVPGVLYTYTVTARSVMGDSAASIGNTGWRSLLAPTGLSATDGALTTGVNLAWNAANGAAGYRVFRAIGSGTPSELGQPTATTFSDTTAVAGTLYVYTVKARAAAGDSPASEPDTGWRSPPAPTNPQASDGTSTAGVVVTWTAATGATGYRVYRALGAGTPFAVGDTTATTLTDTSVEAGTVFNYTVRTLTSLGEGAASAANSGWRNVPFPGNLAASDGAGTTNVQITWDAVPGATGYRVLRGTGTAVPTTVLSSPGTTAFTDTTATPGTLFTYAIRAYTAAGDSATSGTETGWRDVPAVANLIATDGTVTTGVNLTWSTVTGASSYRVLRAIGAGTPTQIGTPTAGSFADTTAAIGTVYAYTVQVVTAAGLSNSTPSSDTGWRGIAAPTNVAATDGTLTTGVDVTWTAASGAGGYAVYRAIGSGSPVLVGETQGTALSDTEVAAGTVFTYTVRALTPAGSSPASGANTGWRNVPPPDGLVASDGTLTTGVQLAWEPVPGATAYRVLRGIGPAVPTAIIASPISGSFLDTTATAGTIYTYAVRATTAAGDSATSSLETGWRNVVTPSNLAATDGTLTTGITVTWTASSGATGYKVFRALGATVPSTEVATVTAATFSDTSATAGVLYTYAVKAVTAAGLTPLSATDTGWRNLPAPTGTVASDGTSTGSITVSWNPVPGALSYEVARIVGATEQTFLFAGPPFVDSTASPGTNYSYKVRALTGVQPSAYGTPDTGWRNIPAPEGLAAGDGTLVTGVQLAWDAVPGATGYRVLRGTGPSVPTTIISSPTTNAYLDTGATAGTVFTYAVRAFTAPGDSATGGTETGWRNVVAPTGLAASSNLSTGVNLTWTASAGAAGYRVYRGLSAGSLVELAAPTASPYLDASADVGVTYTYQVRARTAAGDSQPSGTATGIRTMPSPTGIAASDGTSANAVVVGWNAVPGVSNYRILRAAGSATPTNIIGVVSSGNAYDDTAAVPGTVYNYSVQGVLGGVVSAAGTANTGWRNLPAPTGLAASDGSLITGVSLTWNAVAGTSGYRVFRAIGAATATQVAQVASNLTTYLDASATAGTTYTYTVCAFTTPGNSAPSAADTGWRNVAAPTNLAASDGTLVTGVNITWTASAGAAGYRVFRSEVGGTPSEIAAPTASPFLDTTALPGVTYSYFAKARTASGDSLGQSNSDTGYSGIPAPTGVVAGDGTSIDGVEVTWNLVPGATEYRIFRSGTATPVGTVTGTWFLDLPPAVGTAYTYTVKAYYAPGNLLSVASAGDSGWRNVPAPTGVAATDGTLTTGVNVTWNLVSPPTGVTGYRVFRATGIAAPVQIAAPAATAIAYLDTTAVAGTPYVYTVRAATAAGNSAASAPDGGWRDVAAPTTIAATDGTSTTQVSVTWTAVTGAVGYVVYRGETSTGLVEFATSLAASYNDLSATPGTKYYYQVAAQTSAGLSTRRSPVNDGWRNVPAPANLLASDGTSLSSVTVTWSGVENAIGYRIFRANGSATPTVQVADLGDPTTLAWVDTAVAPGSLYTYAVKAKVAAPGDSALSVLNTGYAGVAPPTNVQATDGTLTTGVTVTWTGISPATGLTGYRIYRSGTATALATVGTATFTFTDAAANAGQAFTYTVKSAFAAGESLNSPSDAGWRNLAAPTNVQATDGTLCAKVRITWAQVNNANVTGYSVFRSIGGATPVEIAIVPQSTAPSYDDLSPPIPLGQVGSYTVQARMAPGNTLSSVANTGFPGNCLAGDGSSDGHGGDLWTGREGGDRAPDGETKEGNGTSSGGTGIGTGIGTGTGSPPQEPIDDGTATDASLSIPECKEACERIRDLLDTLDRDPTLVTKGLVDGLTALIADRRGEGDEGSDACAILAGDVNLDGSVDADDLEAFLLAWADWDLVHGDVDRDGMIGDRDFAIVCRRIAGNPHSGGDGSSAD